MQVNAKKEKVMWRLDAMELTGEGKPGRLLDLTVPPLLDSVPRTCTAAVLATAPASKKPEVSPVDHPWGSHSASSDPFAPEKCSAQVCVEEVPVEDVRIKMPLARRASVV